MSNETKRVFCKGCRNFIGGRHDVWVNGIWERTISERCRVATKAHDVIRGEVLVPSDALVLNKGLDCPHFTPHGAERIRPGRAATVRRSWWLRLRPGTREIVGTAAFVALVAVVMLACWWKP